MSNDDQPSPSPSSQSIPKPSRSPLPQPDLHPQKQFSPKKSHKRLAYGPNYIPEEETIRNDYSKHYVLTGSRPQNHIQNTDLDTRFVEYPKLKKLLQLKKALVANHAHPPTYLQVDLRPSRPNSFNLLDLHPTRFDVILLDPPLKEYVDLYPHLADHPSISSCGGPIGQERPYWSWDDLEALPVPQIAASPGFIFLWCGSGQGSTLEQGRALLAKWGYRKCEDLVWVKTNRLSQPTETNSSSTDPKPIAPIPAVFTPTKEHCLMGIRGTVRRSTDGHFVHCNVDTDVIVSEPDPSDPLHKPKELYQLIENFCLGRRRLDLFGSAKCLRPGWLTIGTECAPEVGDETNSHLPPSERPIPYSKLGYLANFLDAVGRTHNLLPSDTDIDNLRPRSPPSRIAPLLPGSPLTRGMALGYPVPGAVPIIGPDGTILATTISGRNTVSHPSGGLGRGPGNALLPGMRVSGSRDSSNSSNSRSNQNSKNLNHLTATNSFISHHTRQPPFQSGIMHQPISPQTQGSLSPYPLSQPGIRSSSVEGHTGVHHNNYFNWIPQPGPQPNWWNGPQVGYSQPSYGYPSPSQPSVYYHPPFYVHYPHPIQPANDYSRQTPYPYSQPPPPSHPHRNFNPHQNSNPHQNLNSPSVYHHSQPWNFNPQQFQPAHSPSVAYPYHPTPPPSNPPHPQSFSSEHSPKPAGGSHHEFNPAHHAS